MPALILSQLRWLDHVVNGKVSPVCPPPLVLYLWVLCGVIVYECVVVCHRTSVGSCWR